MGESCLAEARTLEPLSAAEPEQTMTGHWVLEEERLVKSSDRVRDLGEVFTPASTVQAMLDLLPDEVWTPHPSCTFFEPAAGDGNFLVGILERKLNRITQGYEARILPAGGGLEAAMFHGLEALASVYAVDISPDNVIGGTPGHEIGARQRLAGLFCDWYERVSGSSLNGRSVVRANASWIVDRNLLVGNMLPTDADGAPSGRERLPLVEYRWHTELSAVSVLRTTLGAVMDEAQAEVSGVHPLFSEEPQPVWTGPAIEIREAQLPKPPLPIGPARNGNGKGSRPC